jgi:hypothetical protein
VGRDTRPQAREVNTSALPPAAAGSVRPLRGSDRGRVWRRWTAATTAGEAAGFLVPVGVVLAGGDDLGTGSRSVLLLLAGAAEGALLGWAQSRVLGSLFPAFPRRDWIVRTALAAALAWAVGMAPSTLGEVGEWPLSARVAAAVPAGLVLLTCIGVAQASVLRRHVAGAGRWIAWTAAAWAAGLGVFTAISTPLWQPGQSSLVVALIGAAAGLAMAGTMAAVTGWGLLRMLEGSRGSPQR